MPRRLTSGASWLCAAALGPAIAGVAAPAEPTFAGEVAPILYRSCVQCHHDEGVGPFPFIEYEDAARRARQIAEVARSGYMPPWKPERGLGPPLLGERFLSEEEIGVLTRWARAGAPAGDLATSPEPPDLSSGWTLGEPDLVLTLPEAYVLGAEGADRFRNFVLPIPIEAKRYVSAFEFLPSSKLAVHHASFALSLSSEPRRRDAADPGPGYDSMDLGDTVNPSGHIIGWTPGQVPYEAHPGTAWELEPGVDLLMQLHLLPTGKAERIQPRIGLHFSDEPPSKTSWVAVLREYDIDIPAGARGHEVEERLRIPADAQVLGLFPHAHYLGKDFRVFAELPDGERRWLLRIPDWDFNWQSDYRFEEPLPLPAGSELVMQLTYDNSQENPRNPNYPPKRVTGGWSSFDEMGEVAIQLLLRDASDLPLFEEASARREIGRPETEAKGWYNLGVALEDQGKSREAAEAYRRSVEVDATYSRAWNNLGALYQEKGDDEGSVRFYQQALRVDPESQEARLNLATAQARTQRVDRAMALLEELLEINERHVEGRRLLAALHLRSGKAAEGLAILERGSAWHRDNGGYLLDLADAYGMNDRLGEARATFARAAASEDAGARAQAWFALAEMDSWEGNSESALASVNRALALQPDFMDAHLLRLPLSYQVEGPSAGRRILSRLLALPPKTRPAPSELVEYLPFPGGVVDLAYELARSGDGPLGLDLLEEASRFARAAGRFEDEAALRLARERLSSGASLGNENEG